MFKTLAILNPNSGRGRSERLWQLVEVELRAHGIEFDLARTHSPLHAVQLAWEAPHKGYGRVLAVGGDGIVHEVVNGLLRASGEGETITLGIVPLGSGNDFNKMVPPVCRVGQTHNDWRAAIKKIAQGKTALVDVGRIVGDNPLPGHPHPHYFDNGMDVGFGALVAKYAKTVPQFLTGTAMYLAAVLKVLANYEIPRLTLYLDNGTRIEQPSTMTAITNGRCVGGGFWIAPEANADDGALDLMIARSLGRAEILSLIPLLMQGKHTTHPAVRMTHAQRVIMDSPDPLAVEADGEIPFLEAHHLEIELLPKRLRIAV